MGYMCERDLIHLLLKLIILILGGSDFGLPIRVRVRIRVRLGGSGLGLF